MKPSDWNQRNAEQKEAVAVDLYNSMRGRLVIAQALAIASKALKAADHPYQEVSNAEDMEMIGEALFQPFYTLELSKRDGTMEAQFNALKKENSE